MKRRFKEKSFRTEIPNLCVAKTQAALHSRKPEMKALKALFMQGLLIAGLAFAASSPVMARQCVKNNSATSLNVQWYNQGGSPDRNASMDIVLAGKLACQNNATLGFSTVSCNGCAWGPAAAKTAIIAGGVALFGVCVVATSGECVLNAPGFAADTVAAVKSVPRAFNGKLIVAPSAGKTVTITGTAFGLNVQ